MCPSCSMTAIAMTNDKYSYLVRCRKLHFTHRGRVTYMRQQDTSIGSDNGLSPGRHYLNQCLDIVNLTLRTEWCFNSSHPGQNGRRHSKYIFLNENVWISIKISLKFVPQVQIHNIPAFVKIMAWRRPRDKSLYEPILVILLTHIYVTRLQWVECNLLHRTK